MRTVYSLREFHQKATQISGKPPEHVRVRAEIGLFNRLVFECYADGMGIYEGKTMEESLDKLQEVVNPAHNNDDVEIEMKDEAVQQPAEIESVQPEPLDDLPF